LKPASALVLLTICGTCPQSYPQLLWIDKKWLKKPEVSGLGDKSHEVEFFAEMPDDKKPVGSNVKECIEIVQRYMSKK
jgi:hypothetical protein